METKRTQLLPLLRLASLLCCCVVVGAVAEGDAAELPPILSNGNFTLADLQRLLSGKCSKAIASASESSTESATNATLLSSAIEAAAGRLTQCVGSLGNFTQLVEEVEAARPLGELDDVFGKYCVKLPTLESCLSDFNDALLPCLSSEERAQNVVLRRIVSKLLEFVCYKNGDRIALFIAEEGPECFEQQREQLNDCLNASLTGYEPQQLLLELPELVVGPRQCLQLHHLELCSVRALEQCHTVTPTNVAESLFAYVRRESNCQVEIDRQLAERAAQLLGEGTEGRGAAAALLPAVGLSLCVLLLRCIL